MKDKELLRKAIEYLKESLTCCLKRKEMEEFVDTYDDWANDLSKQINELEECNLVAQNEHTSTEGHLKSGTKGCGKWSGYGSPCNEGNLCPECKKSAQSEPKK